MSHVAILGGGGGGASACVELVQRGYEVALWNRADGTLDAFQDVGGVPHHGVLGDGVVKLSLISSQLGEVLDRADVAVVCLPALAHSALFEDLAQIGWSGPIVLNPGHTGGALHLRAVYAAFGMPLPPVAELSTLTYVARRAPDGSVHTGLVAARVGGAALPGGKQALDLACEFFPCVEAVGDVLSTSLSDVNLVAHTPGAILSASWVEATAGNFTFYVEAMTPGVVRVIEALDNERLTVARAFGHQLRTIAEEMAAVGTADAAAAARRDTRAAIATDGPNSVLRAPDSLRHRYYVEDFGCGLMPFLALAKVADVEAPVADALLRIGATLVENDFNGNGLGAERLGIAGMDRGDLLKLVREA